MPKIPPVPVWDPRRKKSEFDFCESIYLAMTLFMPKDTVEALEKHYLDNIKPVETLQRMSPDHYDKLIRAFKKKKQEILANKDV